jgi:hypothetical protein
MFSITDLDQRLADHLERVASVDQEAWMREAPAPAGRRRPWAISTAVASLRQRAGLAVVRAGERLQGTPAGRAVDRAAAA